MKRIEKTGEKSPASTQWHCTDDCTKTVPHANVVRCPSPTGNQGPVPMSSSPPRPPPVGQLINTVSELLRIPKRQHKQHSYNVNLPMMNTVMQPPPPPPPPSPSTSNHDFNVGRFVLINHDQGITTADDQGIVVERDQGIVLAHNQGIMVTRNRDIVKARDRGSAAVKGNQGSSAVGVQDYPDGAAAGDTYKPVHESAVFVNVNVMTAVVNKTPVDVQPTQLPPPQQFQDDDAVNNVNDVSCAEECFYLCLSNCGCSIQ